MHVYPRCICTYVCMHVYVCMFVCMTCMHAADVCVYACCVCMRVCIDACMYIHGARGVCAVQQCNPRPGNLVYCSVMHCIVLSCMSITVHICVWTHEPVYVCVCVCARSVEHVMDHMLCAMAAAMALRLAQNLAAMAPHLAQATTHCVPWRPSVPRNTPQLRRDAA